MEEIPSKNKDTCDFLKLYLALNDFEKFASKLKETLSFFIENIEIKDSSISGFKLFKKQIDSIKITIEDDLSDKEIKDIFKQPDDLIASVDSAKALKYMNAVVFLSLEDRYAEI